MNIVIMAGGGGSRLWPLSRKSLPKQFMDLGSGNTLFEETIKRAKQITETKNIYVAAAKEHKQLVKKLTPEIEDNHIFCEPERRDTTAAFASIALRLKHAGQENEPTIFMWSDHIFTNEDQFIQDLKLIPSIIESNPDSIVMVGHTTISAETAFGYMEVGEKVNEQENVYHLKNFKEKPDKETAEKFLADENYFWNIGYFSLKPAYLLSELQAQSPEMTEHIKDFDLALAKENEKEIDEAYIAFPKISIEYTLIEKTKRIIAVTGDYGWSDVGNWRTMHDVFGKDGDFAPKGYHTHVDSKENYIYNTTEKAVSLIGVENCIVVVTDNAVLVTDKENAHKVKEVVQKLEEDEKDEYL